MADKKLSELESRMLELESQIRERKRDIAKENKQAVDTIDQLVCKEHPGSAFKAVRIIPDSPSMKIADDGTITFGEGLNIYRCESCTKGKLYGSKAYDCPNCGIVVGEYTTQTHDSIRILSGAKGVNYHCRICNTQIGKLYWVHS